jgi:hypothetical protein
MGKRISINNRLKPIFSAKSSLEWNMEGRLRESSALLGAREIQTETIIENNIQEEVLANLINLPRTIR